MYLDPYLEFGNGSMLQIWICIKISWTLSTVLSIDSAKPRDFEQCLGSGSGSGSVGSARFWLPGTGSGSAKICGSTDPDPRGKISTKTAKKK